MIDVSLRKADLENASLESADLRGADFTGAKLHNTLLRGANLTGAKGLEIKKIPAINYCGAILPNGSLAKSCEEPY